MRGDGFGSPGLNNTLNGSPIWFVTANKELVTATIAGLQNQNPPAANVVSDGAGNYFTLVIFSQELPTSITPMAVGAVPLDTTVILETTQASPGPNPGGVAAVGPFSLPDPPVCPLAPPFSSFFHGAVVGDSGSPTMLPVPVAGGSPLLVLYGLVEGSWTLNGLQSVHGWALR